jgi:hypothetical protein
MILDHERGFDEYHELDHDELGPDHATDEVEVIATGMIRRASPRSNERPLASRVTVDPDERVYWYADATA